MKFRLFLLCTLFVFKIKAQDSSFTLRAAIDLALKQNLDIQIIGTDLEIAKANNNIGNAGGLPLIAANLVNTEARSNINQKLSNGNSISRNNVSNNAINGNLSISWRVFNGFRVRATKERFETLEKMGELAVGNQIDQVVFNVYNIYFNLVRLNKQMKATKAIIDLSRERLKIAETRFAVGNGAKTDMLQAGIDLNAQEVNLKNIQNNVQNTITALNAVLKRNLDAPFVPLDQQFAIPQLNYRDLSSKIETQNLQILMAQKEKMNLVIDRKIIQSARMPTLTVNSNTVLNKTKSTAGLFLVNQNFGPNIGLGIGIPIFNGNINKTQLKVNQIQQKRQDLEMEQLKNTLQRDLLLAFQDYENALGVVKMEENNVKLAAENNMISTERFRKLQSNSIELRQAQLSLIEAEDRYIQAQFNAQLSANILKFIAGEISKGLN
jgi:outer membrane protein TolC